MKANFAIPLLIGVVLGFTLILLPSLVIPTESSELKLIQKQSITAPRPAVQQSEDSAKQSRAAASEAPTPSDQIGISPSPSPVPLPPNSSVQRAAPLAAKSAPLTEAPEVTSGASGISQQPVTTPPTSESSKIQVGKTKSDRTETVPQSTILGLQNLFVIVVVGLVLASAAFLVTKRRIEI